MEKHIRLGDANQITRDYFDSLLIELRHIGATIPDTSLSLYGHSFATPLMTAALSHLSNCHPEGMVELARGAKAADAVMWAGMGEENELERIVATGAKTIKIIKPYEDNNIIFRKIAHAESCGCIAVGMDIDHAFNRRGEHDIVMGEPMSGKSLEDIKKFVGATKLPFIVKGVLSVRDAQLCIQAGVQGIVVSHHHGIMDYAVPPLRVLPEIVRAINGAMPVFIDCCIVSGFDAFKALAFGATAVSVGRALMEPLSQNGAYGVTQAIKDMTFQLSGAMAHTCSQDITHIDSSVVWTS